MISETIKIILTDDQTIFRQGIATILQGENISIIGEASDGRELLNLIEVRNLKPDVILLDLDMPDGMSGNETLKILKEKHPALKVIIFSLFSDESLIKDFKAKGANSYLTKKITHQELVDTIRRVHYWIDYNNIPNNLKSEYTEREIQMIPLILDGYMNKEIGQLLKLSIKTIEADRAKLYQKAGATSLLEFSNFCAVRGLKFLGNLPPEKTNR
ncbi:MAG: response regulator transcription factor [Bacteroidetes bacterium]|nr:response regulator transcription factor [Bacteroidota bacterium]